jgi:hypothetical protein
MYATDSSFKLRQQDLQCQTSTCLHTRTHTASEHALSPLQYTPVQFFSDKNAYGVHMEYEGTDKILADAWWRLNNSCGFACLQLEMWVLVKFNELLNAYHICACPHSARWYSTPCYGTEKKVWRALWNSNELETDPSHLLRMYIKYKSKLHATGNSESEGLFSCEQLHAPAS